MKNALIVFANRCDEVGHRLIIIGGVEGEVPQSGMAPKALMRREKKQTFHREDAQSAKLFGRGA
jgi:hypothetical protein